MPQAAGEGHHRREGVDERDQSQPEVLDPQDQDNPDEGPTMGGPGAQPGGNAMDHWKTAMPNTDATRPETMPEPVGGTGETPNVAEQSNPA